tara:strand:- start:1347 stop:2402 length:1056 start_codon:yes stop_codon:yes gene_type:complete
MYVELKVKASGITEDKACWVAERAINNVELSIGGQRIDKQYQKWWRLYTELYLDDSKKATYGKMTSGVSGKTVYLPLYFFFNRNPGLYLPLIALQYHEVRLDFDLSAHFDEWLDTSTFKVWANYIYLDTEERRRFAQKGHEYLIEQCQHTGADTVDSGSTKQVRLSYNHPVKELVWCFSNTLTQNSMFNFTAQSNDADVKLHTTATAATSNALVSLSTYGSPMLGLGLGIGGTSTFTEDSVGPLNTFKLVLNGQDRFKEQKGKYFNQVQAFQHHTGSPYAGVYSYSFALKPEEHQPTGTCNFSRIDNAQVAVTMKSDADTSGGDATTMHMFATNYNVLRIQSGMGGLAFSN